APPRVLESVEQGDLVCLQKEDSRVEARLAELPEDLHELLEVVAPTDVRDDGGAAHAAALVTKQLAEGADHSRRQVVDAEIAAVFEGSDRLRFARARVPRDHDQIDFPPAVSRP